MLFLIHNLCIKNIYVYIYTNELREKQANHYVNFDAVEKFFLFFFIFWFDKANLKWKNGFFDIFDACNFKRIFALEIYIFLLQKSHGWIGKEILYINIFKKNWIDKAQQNNLTYRKL